MDAKPAFRGAFAPLTTDENQVPSHVTLHQRAKSSANLKNAGINGGLRLAPKRGAFVDVSNTAQAIVDLRPLGPIKAPLPVIAVPQENALQIVDNRVKPASSAQPLAETGRGNSGPSHALSRHIQATSSTLGDRQIAPTKFKNPQKATIVYTDHAPTLPTSAEVVTEPADSAIGGDSLELKKPRRHKSQPLIKVEQPNLRRTQSRLLRQPGDLMVKEDDTAALYVDAFEQQLQHVDAAAYIRQQHQDESQQILNMDIGRSEDDEQYTEPRAEPQTMKDPPAPSVLAEAEEYWDEDADEVYDDQGYTTAHSYRSHGDNTTGGVTTMLAPKITAKVRKELEVAKAIVEENRTQEEVEEETWDVSMVAEYGDEIFDYMRELEARMMPNAHYMDIQTEIQWSMRAVLMDWLIQVHTRFSLLPETLFLTVNYIDRFLSVKIVSLGKLQLVGATAIFVAAKYEEINCPSIQEIVYMVDSGYTMDEILKAERFMLSMLGFELGWPGPMSFLRRISKADDYDLETRTLAKYFLEVTVMDERFVGSPPSFVAAGAHCLSRLLLKKGDWTPAHVHYSGYTFNQLKPLVSMIFDCCQSPEQHHAAVYEKYRDRRYKRASQYVEEQILQGFSLGFSHTTSRASGPRLAGPGDSALLAYAPREGGLLIPAEG